ncbi:ATP-binding protein [Streptomyces sp. NPDC026672]|uniref:ATP-binding protein n=1 Tax=unclassified Streptomyces TaxID=2593676 RepID=UPI003404C034
MHLVVDAHSVRHIRSIVRSLLAEWGLAQLTDALELAVSELVTNVVRHVPDRRCTVMFARQTVGVRVEVTDGHGELPCRPRASDDEAEGGRGLTLLDAVVDKWGVSPTDEGGKTVWFECTSDHEPWPTGSPRP